MVKRSLVIVLVGLVCVALGATASLAQVEERTFSLKADGLVSVENSAGNTTIHAWEKEEVRMVATRKGRGSDKIVIIIDASEDHLKIETEYPRFSWFQRARVNYELWVPEGATVKAESSSGDLRIEGQRSDVRAQASSGDIELKDIWGEIDVSASSGSIRTEDSKGDISARTSSGTIRILGVEESERPNDIRVHASSGSVTLKDIVGDIDAETSSGKIDAENVEGIITARASSGSIKILEARGGVKTLRTSSGEIWVELEEIYEGILEMSFQSTSGDINLSIPSDTGADIDISTTSGRITTDFAVTVEGTMERNEFRGAIGEGGIFIKLRATSGDVTLGKM